MMYYDPRKDLLHYGVLGMKWGIRSYQPYQKGSKKEGREDFYTKYKIEKKLNTTYSNSTKKFKKISSKVLKQQDVANKYYDKFAKKQQSRFSSKSSVNKSLDKATSAQRKLNDLKKNAAKWYKTMEEEFKKIDWDVGELDPEIKRVGQSYIDDLSKNAYDIFNMRPYDQYKKKHIGGFQNEFRRSL